MGNKRGQAVVEAAVALPVFALGFAIVLYLTYHGLVFFYASYQLEEAMICATEQDKAPDCERAFQKRVRSVLIFGEKSTVLLRTDADRISGKAEIQLYEKVRIEKILRRALEKNL